jgi:hypothetical protein
MVLAVLGAARVKWLWHSKSGRDHGVVNAAAQ